MALRLAIIALLASGGVSGAAIAEQITPIESADCAVFTEVEDGVNAECGVLQVPENRADPESRLIGVPFARIRSTAAEPDPDPQIFMTGGPGGRTIPRRLSNRNPILASRDLIFLEQRGSPLGRPALQCPEYTEAGYQAAIGALTAKELANARIEAAKTCAERFRAEGGDLAGYTTEAIAGDIELLRKALGIETLNLYGLSYSGKVMTTYARDYPASTRSLVLNSPLTVEANYDEYGSTGMRRTLDLVVEGCALNTACAAAFPDLRGQFEEIVRRGWRKPQTVLVGGPGGETTKVRVDGRVLADTLLNMLYAQESIEILPRFIDAIHRDGAQAAAGLIDISRSDYAWLQRIAIWCNEEYPFENPEAIRRQETAYPEFAGVDQSTVPPGLCAAAGFDAHPDPKENEPVRTDAPVLIFAGEFDPATPPAISAAMIANMPNARHLVAPGAGHGAGFSQCGVDITVAFTEAPHEAVDVSCVLKMRGADFSRTAAPD